MMAMETNPDNELARLIRKRFRASGWSIRQLSKRAGIAYASCHGFINADRDATCATASKLCKALGLELRTVGQASRKPKG